MKTSLRLSILNRVMQIMTEDVNQSNPGCDVAECPEFLLRDLFVRQAKHGNNH